MLQAFPTGLVAVVSDSYNIWCVSVSSHCQHPIYLNLVEPYLVQARIIVIIREACRDLWGGELKGIVEARNGTLVVRPGMLLYIVMHIGPHTHVVY